MRAEDRAAPYFSFPGFLLNAAFHAQDGRATRPEGLELLLRRFSF